jgi:glycosyltransferase involved in cell wall biosynthesis
LRPRLTALIEGASMRRADRWCSVSQYTADRTAELFGLEPAAAVHYNFVEPAPARRAVRSRNRVVFTGTLTHKKGIESLIQAWNLVVDIRHDARLHIYGKDVSSMEVRLRAQLDDSALASVQFHGHTPREQVLEALSTARVAVFPSWAEAFAFAPLEAMAAGCPTISSTRTSGPEAITDGRDGLLVDPAEPAQIAATILRVLDDDVLAERLGRAGRERVERCFSCDTTLEEIERFYIDTIHNTGALRNEAATSAHTTAWN